MNSSTKTLIQFSFIVLYSITLLASGRPSIALTLTPTARISPTPTGKPRAGGTPTGVPPAATPTVSEEQVKQSLKDRLKKAVEDKSQEAQQVLTSTQRRAVVGTVKDVANNALTITSKNGGATTLAATTDKTTVVKGGKALKFEDIGIGDAVIAMGYPGAQNDVLDTRRIVVVDKLTSRNEKILLGTASSIKTKTPSLTLTVKQPTELGGDETFTVVVPKKSNVDMSTLIENSQVIIVATVDPKNSSTLNLLKLKVL